MLSVGTRVRVWLSSAASNKSLRRLQELHSQLNNHTLFSWSHTRVELPNLLVIDERIVALSSTTWFSSSGDAELGFVVHLRDLASSLHTFVRKHAERAS